MVNTWSLVKHKSIKMLLLMLQSKLGSESFCIDHDEKSHFYAITLYNPDRPEVRSYIFSYGQQCNHYGVHLEFPMNTENELNNSIQVYENVSIDQTIKMLASHFEVSSYGMAV
jgi:hypothetical protein